LQFTRRGKIKPQPLKGILHHTERGRHWIACSGKPVLLLLIAVPSPMPKYKNLRAMSLIILLNCPSLMVKGSGEGPKHAGQN
jgi:hypothetical protein